MKVLSTSKSHGGIQGVYSHASAVCACDMTFAVFMPPQAGQGPVPVLWYLSGLTCTHANVMDKGEYRRLAAELGIAIVCPDTSPRGADVPDEKDNWQFGCGAGFYVDATQEPYARNYRMYSYVTEELPALLAANFPVDMARQSIFGHSMGGHGAIRLAMRHPEVFGAVYALHPIGMGPGLQTMFSRPNWQLLQGARGIDDLRGDGFSLIFTSIFQAHLPDAARPPLFFDPPARLKDGRLEVDPALTERLNASFFLERQVPAHADNLRRLRGFMFDWGRGDANPDHIVSLQAFTRTLDAFGVPYEGEEYRGGWGARHWGEDGRLYPEMLPFFARKLVF